MIQLNEELLQEIVDNSNHKTIESVKQAIYTGDIAFYENLKAYEKDEHSLAYEDYYHELRNGAVVHFLGR